MATPPGRTATQPPVSPPLPSQGHGVHANATFVNCVPYPLSDQLHPKIHSVLIFLVYFLCPLVIISVYYYHIARTLIRSAHDMPGELRDHTRRQVNASTAGVRGRRPSPAPVRKNRKSPATAGGGVRANEGRGQQAELRGKERVIQTASGRIR